MDQNSLSHIHLIKEEMLEPCEWKGSLELLNIVMVGITNAIPEHNEEYEMHRLIGTLLSSELKEQQKLDIIENEYKIPVNSVFREEIKSMCNLGEGIEERAAEKTIEGVVVNMYENKFSLEQIAIATRKDVNEIEKIVRESKLILA